MGGVGRPCDSEKTSSSLLSALSTTAVELALHSQPAALTPHRENISVFTQTKGGKRTNKRCNDTLSPCLLRLYIDYVKCDFPGREGKA